MNVKLKRSKNRYKESQRLFKRAAKVIPCGIYGHYSPAPLIPATDYPFFTERAEGPCFWDVDGNKYIDYMCAYGPMVHGYHHEAIDRAAREEVSRGNCVTGASPLMVELAEYLVNMTDGAEWAFFAKNGADVTNFAVMIARFATGRKKIIMYNGGYHGTSPWMQAPGHHGVMEEDTEHVLRINWNDADAFQEAVDANHNDVAAVIASPYLVPAFADNALPAPGYWDEVQKICRKNGILIISDDIRHGFRINLKGSHVHYGYEPDLICYCKAIANGYPISALLGTESLKNVTAKVFYTGSYWFQSEPMAAALATLREHKRINTPKVVKEKGEMLSQGLIQLAQDYGYTMQMTGEPAMPYYRITNDPSLMLHQDWCAECTRGGAYFASHHNWFLSTAHSTRDIKRTLEIADEAFQRISKKYGERFTDKGGV